MSLAMTDQIHHPQAFHAVSPSQYEPVLSNNAMAIDVDGHAHHMHSLSPQVSMPGNSSLVYGQQSHLPFSTDARQQQHFTPHQSHFHPPPHGAHHSPSPHTTAISEHPMAVNPTQLRRTGPHRVMTRRQARAQASQLGIDPHSANGNTHQSQSFYNQEGYLLYPNTAAPADPLRPATPTRLASDNFQHQRSVSDMHANANRHAKMSPPDPSPASCSSSYSNYGFHPYPTHSRSTSSSTHPRSNSPAMSVVSAATSLSSSSSTRRPPLSAAAGIASFASTPAKTKKRLVNRERKEICEFAAKNPDTRQEDIASKYGVERSTVSKILKQKDKWLSIAEGENNLVAKHRPSKFPTIELLLESWLEECRKNRTPISDSMIRAKAREVARTLSLGEDKFKASSGWVENYKHRHGIRKGVWEGKKTNENDNFDPGLEVPDLEDELQMYSGEAPCFPDTQNTEVEKEHDQFSQLKEEEQNTVGAVHHSDSVMDVAAVESSQRHTEESSVSPVTPDQWPPPPPESMGIAPHETYRELPAQQLAISLSVPHMSQALQEVHVPQPDPLPSSEHHDIHSVYQHDSTVREMMSAHEALQDHGVVDGHIINHTHAITLIDFQQQQQHQVGQVIPQQTQQQQDPSPEQNWNTTSGSARHISAQQASECITIAAMYIKANRPDIITIHETNVLDSIQKALQSNAQSS